MAKPIQLVFGGPRGAIDVELTNGVGDSRTFMGIVEIGGVDFMIDAVLRDAQTEDFVVTEIDKTLEAVGHRVVPRHLMTIGDDKYLVAIYPADP